jgi:hypothetical protein
LRRWLGVAESAPSPEEPVHQLSRRVAILEEHVDFLAGSLRKLRGRVTGAIRNPDQGGESGDPVSDAPTAHPVGNPRAIEMLRKRGRL